MSWRSAAAAGLLAGLLAGCSEPPAETGAADSEESVFDPLLGTLDRAEGVQQTVDERAAELRRQLEEAEGP